MMEIIDDEEKREKYSQGRGWRYIQANACIPAIWSDDLPPTTHIAARSCSGARSGYIMESIMMSKCSLYLIRCPARTNIKVGSLRPTRTKFLFILVSEAV